MEEPRKDRFIHDPLVERRRPSHSLRRATREAEILEERIIDRWLEFGRIALEEDPFGMRRRDRRLGVA